MCGEGRGSTRPLTQVLSRFSSIRYAHCPSRRGRGQDRVLSGLDFLRALRERAPYRVVRMFFRYAAFSSTQFSTSSSSAFGLAFLGFALAFVFSFGSALAFGAFAA